MVPYLRGYGPTRFLDPETPRSGQQAALAADLLTLLEALQLGPAVLAGYDWGGRAACIVAALWPERVRGLVSGNGYNIHDIARSGAPDTAENEHRLWYQYYFHGERGPGRADQGSPRPCAGCCGSSGRRSGSSTTRPMPAAPLPSTIRISSRW
ncbi:MAG: alpha/beta hydrolase [Aliidongia sp.]